MLSMLTSTDAGLPVSRRRLVRTGCKPGGDAILFRVHAFAVSCLDQMDHDVFESLERP